MLVAICDDEKVDREKTGKILVQEMKIRQEPLQLSYFVQGDDLLEQYENGNPGYDLIFMDIYLKRMNGIDIVRQIRKFDKKVAVVFLTSSLDYAVESYDVRASGYLIKPFTLGKMEDVINRFMEEHHPRIKNSLFLVNGNSGKRIDFDEIMYIESRRMNLRIVCRDGMEHTIRKKLDDIYAELAQMRFLKCNQSYIVNMDYIISADSDFTMENGDKIPIKVREKKRIREQYFSYVLMCGWMNVE